MTRIDNLVTSVREYQALMTVEKLRMAAQILYPNRGPPITSDPLRLKESSKLNYPQNLALQSTGKEGFILIQGPPGTGKTQTIVSIITAHRKRGNNFLSNPIYYTNSNWSILTLLRERKNNASLCTI